MDGACLVGAVVVEGARDRDKGIGVSNRLEHIVLDALRHRVLLGAGEEGAEGRHRPVACRGVRHVRCQADPQEAGREQSREVVLV